MPDGTGDLAPFFQAAGEGRLVVQRCTKCGALRFPARSLCSDCLHREAEWVPVSGRGRVFSYNVMHQIYHPAFAGEVPYAVVLVELDEGPRLVSNLVDCPREALAIDLPVEVVFERQEDGRSLPKFRPRRD